MEIYLDNSATTRPCEAAILAAEESMRECFYNPSALYGQAFRAEKKITECRKLIAATLGANEKNVIFTSGGTESDNLAIWGLLSTSRSQGQILFSAGEHDAVKNTCLAAGEKLHRKVQEIPLTREGRLDLNALEELLREETALICVMQVCNETGAIFPIREVCRLRDELAPDGRIHVDGVQGYLRVPFSLKDCRVQSYALSGHKIHAPKGIGALVLGENVRLSPLMQGGGQQNGLRSGTENTPGIAGLGAAVSAFPKDGGAKMAQMKMRLAEKLRERIPGMRINGPLPGEEDGAGHILNVSFPPVRSETLLHAMEGCGIVIGTGSACSAKKGKHSRVLEAMGVPYDGLESAVRISLSVENTPEEMDICAEKLAENVSFLSRFVRR